MYKSYTVIHDNIQFTDRAVGLRIKRDDGVWASNPVWFPLSCVTVEKQGAYYKVVIPEYWVKRKVPEKYTIVEVW
jgi:hypothetical protein